MTQEPQKNNSVLIVIAIIGVVGTIVASAIGAMANYNIEKERQGFELTRIALVSIATQGGVTQMALQSTVNAPTELPASTYTPPPTYTSFPTLPPTETPIPPPTATLFVPPADGILFQDNFDSGDLSAWTQVSGKWIVSNGKLSKLINEDSTNEYQWISLKRPEWKNYVLSLDVNKPSNNAVAIALRDDLSAQPIGLEIGWGHTTNLVLLSNNQYENTDISGRTGVGIQGGVDTNIQLEVQGDTYILRLNGREIQKVTLSGYESGGISIGAYCPTDDYGCTKFDNVKVTYLP